jgi:hypothetical protein
VPSRPGERGIRLLRCKIAIILLKNNMKIGQREAS